MSRHITKTEVYEFCQFRRLSSRHIIHATDEQMKSELIDHYFPNLNYVLGMLKSLTVRQIKRKLKRLLLGIYYLIQ